MSNLINHAEKELRIAGFFDEDSGYNGMLGPAVMELIEVFSDQGHSGMSASIVRSIFGKLANYKPLTPLNFSNDEWGTGAGIFQNNRNSAVFKEGENDRPYYIRAYYMRSQTGSTFSGRLSVGEGREVRRCYIKDSSKMPEICIDVVEKEVNKDTGVDEPGSGLHRAGRQRNEPERAQSDVCP